MRRDLRTMSNVSVHIMLPCSGELSMGLFLSWFTVAASGHKHRPEYSGSSLIASNCLVV